MLKEKNILGRIEKIDTQEMKLKKVSKVVAGKTKNQAQ